MSSDAKHLLSGIEDDLNKVAAGLYALDHIGTVQLESLLKRIDACRTRVSVLRDFDYDPIHLWNPPMGGAA